MRSCILDAEIAIYRIAAQFSARIDRGHDIPDLEHLGSCHMLGEFSYVIIRRIQDQI